MSGNDRGSILHACHRERQGLSRVRCGFNQSKGGGKEEPGFISQICYVELVELWNCCMCEYVEVAEHMVVN